MTFNAEQRARERMRQGQAKPNGAAGTSNQLPQFLSATDFIAGYSPQRPLIRSWDLKAGWLYSLTAPTGGAKTAIALAEAVQLALAGKSVVYLAGENADDVRARMILMQAELGLDQMPATLRFVDRTFDLHEGADHVRSEVASIGGADLIYVDTRPCSTSHQAAQTRIAISKPSNGRCASAN